MFEELVAALNTLEKIAWMRLDNETVRFTVIPDTGSQVWAFVFLLFRFVLIVSLFLLWI